MSNEIGFEASLKLPFVNSEILLNLGDLQEYPGLVEVAQEARNRLEQLRKKLRAA